MVLGTLGAAKCAGCRLAVLRSFTSLAGFSIRAPRILPTYSIYRISTQQLRRLTQDNRNLRISSHGDEAAHKQGEAENIEDTTENTQASATPWYLQVESPEMVPQQLSERQQIPDLPDSPPPILQPLLQQISIDLGLDDLSLLDLRTLDPPPALGANLLMILGTARSEKHLHVSADRLCRWLRSVYKLKPDADGLLGRNELKLKLKRKAKRAKLMGSVDDDNEDDGVRTGWVCVDVGVVEGDESEGKPEPERKGFVGFGRQTDGVRIVVQMLTEEKREEIDLERLWGGILERGTRQLVDEIAKPLSQPTARQPLPPPLRSSNMGLNPSFGQTRKIHSVRRVVKALDDPDSVVPGASVPRSSNPTKISIPSEKEIIESVRNAIDIARRDSIAIKLPVNEIVMCGQYYSHLRRSKWRPFFRSILVLYLEALPKDRAIFELGRDEKEILHKRLSTDYLKCHFITTEHPPKDADFAQQIWLQTYAGSIHHGYTFDGLSSIFEAMQSSGVAISVQTYKYLLRGCLEWPYNHHTRMCHLELAMQVLQGMHDQGIDILQEDILVSLQEAIVEGLSRSEAETAPSTQEGRSRDAMVTSTVKDQGYHTVDTISSLPSSIAPGIVTRLHYLFRQLKLPLFSEKSRMRLMRLYAERQYWGFFWDIFRMAAQGNMSQSGAIYNFMFKTIAATRSQLACINVLRNWVPVMEQEKPSIQPAVVLDGLKACLLITDPDIEKYDLNSPDDGGEWVALYRRYIMSKSS